MITRSLSRMIGASIAAARATASFSIPALAQDVIKVGAPLPLTGPLAPEGLKQKRGYDLWAETANAKGGIKAGGKTYKIEIVYTDYASNTPRAVQAAERMITEDKVNFLFAPFGSGATKAASAISEKYRRADARADGVLGGNLRSGLQIHLRNADRQFVSLGPDRQAGAREEQGHQTSRCPRTQRPVPAGGRAGVRKGGQGRRHGSGGVGTLRHRHHGSFCRDHPDARGAARLVLRLGLHQRPDPHPQADERSRPQGAGHHR